MPEYKNTPEGFATLRKLIIRRMIPVLLISGSTPIIISVIERNEKAGLYIWLIAMVLIILVYIRAMAKSIKQQRMVYDSYHLILGNDYLSRQQNGLPAITLYFNDIADITVNKYGYLLVKGKQASDVITISAYLENYEQVKDILEAVQPIELVERKGLLIRYPLILPIVIVGLMATIYTSTNKIIVASSGAVLIAIMGWSFYKIRTAPLIDARIKRTSWWLLIVFASIVAIVYYKLFAA